MQHLAPPETKFIFILDHKKLENSVTNSTKLPYINNNAQLEEPVRVYKTQKSEF